jgi:hydroxymethylglutaryl-CoA lyase
MTGFRLRDVTLRDGLQLTGKLLPTAQKLRLARSLLALGVDELEIGAMARPDLVPPMANTLEVIEGLAEDELARCWVWVATPRSARRAMEGGARNLQYCLSASDSHNRANVGRSTEQSLAALPEVVRDAAAFGAHVQLTIATSFTCPFEGPIAPERVLAIATDPRADGVVSVAICDTLGQAVPAEVAALTGATRAALPEEVGLLFHGHDTWGLGVANAIAALGAGADTLDASLAGLGGCPFAPGASGNTATEDVLFALRPDWFTPEVFGALRGLNAELVAAVGEPDRAHATHAADLTPPDAPFPWARAGVLSPPR